MQRPTLCLVVCATLAALASSGCHRNLSRFGPPPPAYACDWYGGDGYDAYGGYNECVDDGQYYTSRRDQRRYHRDERRTDRRYGRDDHRSWDGRTMNGLPVVAAYLVPMDMSDGMGCGCGCGGCGGWEVCGSGCGDCFPCSACGDCGPCGNSMPCGQCSGNGCAVDSQWPSHHSAEMAPLPQDSYSYPGGGTSDPMMAPIPVPPAEEGPWNPPAYPSTPRSNPEPEASRPVPNATWIPSRLQ